MRRRGSRHVSGEASAHRVGDRDQSGASLLFVLMLVMVGGIIMIALSTYASTSAKTTQSFNDVRAERYAGDGAIKTAVNWIKDNPGVAVDPVYAPSSNDDCKFELTGVSVTCETNPGSGSGVPPEQGSLPPETVLLLGDRHNEPGPYSFSQCQSFWDNFVRFFTNDTQGSSEPSFALQKARRSSGFLNLGSCQDRARGNGPVEIKGDVVAAGKIRFTSPLVNNLDLDVTDGAGTVRARYGCEPGNAVCTTWQANRPAGPKPWDGTPSQSDPGRTTFPAADSPINDLRDEFLPIGFDADGTLRDGYTLPARTQAYIYDTTVNTTGSAALPKFMKAINSCADAPAGTPIIFLPGWYKDSELLSKYTGAVNSCYDRTFWFPPNAGPDSTLLTDDDETGAYYLDFVGPTGRNCGTMNIAVAARWCVGGSGADNYNTKPRVVVGWPKDWAPFPASGTAGPSSPVYGSAVPVELNTAADIAGSFLTYWSSTNSAKSIDGNYATYAPCSFWIFSCPTLGQRTLRMENYGPKVTSGPLAESGAPNGRLRVEVRYGVQFGSALGTPFVDIDALDRDGVAVNCGSYQMVNDASVDFNGSGPLPANKKYVFTDAQATQLADSCGAVELINNLRLTLRIGGNILNNPLSKIFLDGARIYYNSYQGASFPVGTDNAYVSTKPAKSDCDETKPGAQLIFGGESHAVVADGSLEVCGGPDPDNPATAQVIGIYGIPAMETVRPSSVAVDPGSGGSSSTQLVNASKATRIGEPAGGELSATIRYPGRCYGAFGIGPCDPVDGGAKDVVANMPQVDVPSGYQVKQIAARASYSAEGPFLGFTAGSDGAKLKAGACSEDARTTNQELRHWTNEGTNNASKLVLYQRGTSRNCISPATLASGSGSQVRWKTNVPGGWGVVFGGRCFVLIGFCNYTQEDRLEGIELDVTIEPTNSAVPRLRPQSGCITAHPNYTAGEGTPDCAVVRAESFSSADSAEGVPVRGNWVGRISVKGTIYAPSSAVEIDDNDIAYPLATRGVILRHLRISGAKARAGYTDPMFGGDIDDSPAARVTVLTACTQTPAVQAIALSARQPCGDNPGDEILTKAGVTFRGAEIPSQYNPANAPIIEWWSDRNTTGAS